jgi:DNA-binding XRE family transcriptional regulator
MVPFLPPPIEQDHEVNYESDGNEASNRHVHLWSLRRRSVGLRLASACQLVPSIRLKGILPMATTSACDWDRGRAEAGAMDVRPLACGIAATNRSIAPTSVLISTKAQRGFGMVHYNASQLIAHPVRLGACRKTCGAWWGRNVQRLRKAAGLTQAQLAERMGVDRAYVSGLELGERNPTIVTLWHAAKALEAKIRSLFDEEKASRRAR